MSRSTKSIRNISVGFIGQILTMLLSFVTRTVFIQTLGPKYLGVSGLFSNIITLLSLTELGVGTAIIYNLYKPLADNDIENICKFMNLYKLAYRIIGLVILIIGILCLPFIPFIIKKGDTSFFNVNIVFLLYLLQSVSTYLFFAYKSSLVKANQNEYIATGITTIVTVVMDIIKIVSLIVFENFYVYLVLIILNNLISNLIISFIVDKKYAYLKGNKHKYPGKQEIKEVFKNCGALSIYKLNNVVLKTCSNIVITKFINLVVVGLYSNYILIEGYLKNFLNILYNGILASLGNLHVSDEKDREYQVFKTTNFLTFWLFGVVAIGICTVINPLISIWLGDEFLLKESFVIVFAIEFYLYGMLKALSTFRTAMGLFKQAVFRPLLGAIINVVMAVVLVKPYGITGVISATLIANLSTYFVFDSFIIYKHALKQSAVKYYLMQFKYAVVVFGCGAVIKYGVSFFSSDILKFLIGGLISVLLPSAIICVFFRHTKEFKDVKSRIENILKKRLKKGEDNG